MSESSGSTSDGAPRDRRGPRPDTARGYIEALPADLAFDRLPAPILAVDADGTVVYVNTAFEQMLGYQRSEIVGSPADDLFEHTPNPSLVGVELRERADDIIGLVHSDGSIVRALVSKSVLAREDDPIALVVFHDVTEQLWTLGHVTEHRRA